MAQRGSVCGGNTLELWSRGLQARHRLTRALVERRYVCSIEQSDAMAPVSDTDWHLKVAAEHGLLGCKGDFVSDRDNGHGWQSADSIHRLPVSVND